MQTACAAKWLPLRVLVVMPCIEPLRAPPVKPGKLTPSALPNRAVIIPVQNSSTLPNCAMSMLTPLASEIVKVEDLAHEARRFRTILWSFERNMDLLFRDTGLNVEVDHERLAQAFARWRQAFDEARYLAETDRRDFVIFAAGLMLKELIAAQPLKTIPAQDLAGLALGHDHRLKRWPEGYAYTSLLPVGCRRRAEGNRPRRTQLRAPRADDAAFWDSFRENSLESPAMAVAFFDLVCGEDPNWDAPDVPWLRHVVGRGQALESAAQTRKVTGDSL